jgi:hypothetical protein
MFNNKANLFRSSYSKSNKFNDISGHRASSRRASLKDLYAALLISTRSLHGCSILENAGAYSPEQPLSSINTLLLSLLILAKCERT